MEDTNLNEPLHFENRLDISPLYEQMQKVRNEIGKVIVGQTQTIDKLLVSILANGHVLLEGVPGVAKTITAKLLAKTMNVGFSRIQFTPDLMPSDILGTSIFDSRSSGFTFKKGPVFSNLILIDEINRAPAKTQAALFEVMEERQITMDGTTYEMSSPFLVIATQNPIEHEGTYRLPEAQLDRFLFKIEIDYPTQSEEVEILSREHLLAGASKIDVISSFLDGPVLSEYQQTVRKVIAEPRLLEYITAIVCNTRENPLLYLGASPRASIAILIGAKAFAALRGRDFVTPEDIRDAAIPALIHRVIVAPEREMEGLTAKQIIRQIMESIEIPR
ncbi:MAG: MoxR family ATPase [Saprospiraceae bacterium]|nr:MoxR family ATPase [Saprospiraceae bacterium]